LPGVALAKPGGANPESKRIVLSLVQSIKEIKNDWKQQAEKRREQREEDPPPPSLKESQKADRATRTHPEKTSQRLYAIDLKRQGFKKRAHSMPSETKKIVRSLVLFPQKWHNHYKNSARFQHSGEFQQHLFWILRMLQHDHAEDAIDGIASEGNSLKVAANIEPGVIPSSVTVACIQRNISSPLEVVSVPRFPGARVEDNLMRLQLLRDPLNFSFNEVLYWIQPDKNSLGKHPFGKGFEP
jgi:hypothetical protein